MDTIGDLKRTEKLLKIINEKGVAWAAAALVSGSIGYYSPNKALLIIENLLKEKKLRWRGTNLLLLQRRSIRRDAI